MSTALEADADICLTTGDVLRHRIDCEINFASAAVQFSGIIPFYACMKILSIRR